MTAQTLTLPPPTALDLAVVRARLELRELRIPGTSYRWWRTRLARRILLLLAVFLPLTAAAMFADTATGRSWIAAAAATVVVLATAQFRRDTRRVRDGDEQVRVHLRRHGGTTSDDLRPVPAGAVAGVAVASLSSLTGLTYAGLLARAQPSVPALLTVMGQVAVIVVMAATLRPLLAPAPGWGGTVLDEVDTALRRSDIAGVLPATALAAVAVPLTTLGSGDVLPFPAIVPVLLVLGAQRLAHPGGVEDPLLRDPRLSFAPPAATWLSESPA